MTGDEWLASANSSDLLALADALETHRLAPPYSDAAASAAGLAGAASLLATLGSTAPAVSARFLRALAAERAGAVDRHARSAQLVWTGPAEDRLGARDTRSVLLDLVQRAEKSVVLTTYVLAGSTDVLAGLANRRRESPSLNVELYVDVSRQPGATHAERAGSFRERFEANYWPRDVPLPQVFHVPPRALGDRALVLHAKVAVVDERFALVTSANLTDAAQQHNLEAGVLLDNRVIAQALANRFRRLRAAGLLTPLLP